MEAPITYISNFVPNPEIAFQILWDQLPWVQHDKVPRRECYYNDIQVPYTYGVAEFARTYFPQPSYHPAVDELRNMVERELKTRFEVCFINGYATGSDQLGWHADDSPSMDDGRPIVTMSLYEKEHFPREIWFIANKFGNDIRHVEKLRLENGSIAIMAPGMQDTHKHRIPKSDRQNCGKRISLTLRGHYAV